MSAQAILLTCLIACLLGMVIGYVKGRHDGNAEGWLDHYFDEVQRDRAKRNKLGQFTSNKTTSA